MATDPHAHDPAADHGPSYRAYMVVALALGVFTAASFGVNRLVNDHVLEPHVGFLLILGVAVCKAVLVGLYFMHLLLDWRRLYFMIVPAFILGAMMAMVLLPDIVLAWLHVPESPLTTGKQAGGARQHP